MMGIRRTLIVISIALPPSLASAQAQQ